MTYILLNETNQTIEYPPINKDNICNYNLSPELMETDGYVDIEGDLIDLFNQGKAKIVGNTIVDISETQEYKKKVRLAEIEVGLNSADDTYTTYLDTPVQYINGFYYKPKYVQETYISLITAGTINPSLFPMVIWDSTELEENAVSMSLSELISLTTYLAGVQQIAFNSRKQQRASLIAEQQSLLQSS